MKVTMLAAINLLLLYTFALSLTGCKKNQEPREASFAEMFPNILMNDQIELKFPRNNPKLAGEDWILLTIENKSREYVSFANDFGIQIFNYSNERLIWNKIRNNMDYIGNRSIINPHGGCLLSGTGVIISPDTAEIHAPSQLAKRIEQVNILKISKDNELAQNEHKRDELAAEKKINENEMEEIDVEVENASQRERHLQAELMQLNQQRKELEQQVEEFSMLAEEKEHLKKSVQEEITAVKVGLAQRQEKKDGLSKALQRLDAEVRETQAQITQSIQECQNCQQKRLEAEEEIQHLELLLSELGTKSGTPLAVIEVGKDGLAEWQPAFPEYKAPGLELQYVLRVYSADGHFDETKPLPIWIVDHQAADIVEKDAERELLVGYGENHLVTENFRKNGGTINVYGSDVPAEHSVFVAGRSVPVGSDGKFVSEEILPSGQHTVEVAILDRAGNGDLFLRGLDLKNMTGSTSTSPTSPVRGTEPLSSPSLSPSARTSTRSIATSRRMPTARKFSRRWQTRRRRKRTTPS